MNTRIARREFITMATFAGGGLVLGFMAGCRNDSHKVAGEKQAGFQPNAYLKIDPSGQVTLYIVRQEMGQGVNTALPMLIAEELDVRFEDIEVALAPFGTAAPLEYQTGGSQSVLTDHMNLRKAGAVARYLLIAAAARQWGVNHEKCVTREGKVVHPSGSPALGYGDLAIAAAKIPVPKVVPLKRREAFRLVGRATPRTNLKKILTGQMTYGIDVTVPGMVYAVVERCPVLGGTLKTFDDQACKSVPGFIGTVAFEGSGKPMHVHAGVAVLARDTWSALQARSVFKATWEDGDRAADSTDELFSKFEERSKTGPAIAVFKKGDADHALCSARLESVYSAPLLAHGAMEPINIIASVKDGRVALWCGSQDPDTAIQGIADELGYKRDHITMHLQFMGGAFGRRLYHDYVLEAVKIAAKAGAPVKVVWDRTDDVRNDAFRPANYHRMQAGWDASGKLQMWQHHVLGTPVSLMREGAGASDEAEIEGGASSNLWYDVPNVFNGYTGVDINVNRGWVRAVDVCQNVFPVECFIDEIAVRQKKDPVQFRLSLLDGRPAREDKTTGFRQEPQRIADVLKLAADRSGYHQPREKDHFIGVAAHHFTFANSYAAHAIEIEMMAPRKFRIVKIVAAVDCGMVVNPDGMVNQIEGGTVFALSQALMSEITVKNSRVEQDGFFTFQVLRMNEMPPVEVYSITSDASPGGIGEIGLPTVAPALCNALAAAGYRPRRLPIRKEGFEWT